VKFNLGLMSVKKYACEVSDQTSKKGLVRTLHLTLKKQA